MLDYQIAGRQVSQRGGAQADTIPVTRISLHFRQVLQSRPSCFAFRRDRRSCTKARLSSAPANAPCAAVSLRRASRTPSSSTKSERGQATDKTLSSCFENTNAHPRLQHAARFYSKALEACTHRRNHRSPNRQSCRRFSIRTYDSNHYLCSKTFRLERWFPRPGCYPSTLPSRPCGLRNRDSIRRSGLGRCRSVG